MRTIETKVYTFDELSDSAKEKAIENWRNSETEYAWSAEWMDSLREFCRVTGIELRDWSIGPYSYSYIKTEYRPSYDFENEDIKGWRLRTWLIDNWLPLFATGKYYSTSKQVDGKYYYKSRHSNIMIEHDNAPLTGFMGDTDLIAPVLDFINRKGELFSLRSWEQIDLDDIVQESMNNFISGYNADMEAQDSDEYIEDTIQANGYEFTAAGDIV